MGKEQLMDLALRAEEILTECRETDFSELKKKDKQRIFDLFAESSLKRICGGDPNGACCLFGLTIGIQEFEIDFWSCADNLCEGDMREELIGMSFLVDGIEFEIDEFISTMKVVKESETPKLALPNTSRVERKKEMIQIVLKSGYAELIFEFEEMAEAQTFQATALTRHEKNSEEKLAVEIRLKEES